MHAKTPTVHKQIYKLVPADRIETDLPSVILRISELIGDYNDG